MEVIIHSNEKLQSKEQKIKFKKVGYTKKLPEGIRKQKTCYK